jgi:hypothetical protein
MDVNEHEKNLLRSARATLVAVALLVSAGAKLYSNNRYSDWGRRFDDQKGR